MAVKVDLTLNDGSFSSRIKQAVQTFGTLKTAITSAKNAQMAFNNVLKANPFGLISTAATMAGEALYNYVTGVYDAQRAQAKFDDVLKNTKQQLATMADDVDFDIAIAKASGTSAMALANMRVEAAKARLALADLNFDKIAAPDSKASSEQIAEARRIQSEAEQALNKANRERTILDVQRIHGTGIYKPTGGRHNSGRSGNIKELTEEQQNQQKINAYIQEYISLRKQAGTPENVERLAYLQEEISRLKQINEQLALYKEQAQGRLLPQNTDLSNIHESLAPQKNETTQVQSRNFSNWRPTSDKEFKKMLDEFGDKIAKAQEDYIKSNQNSGGNMPQGLKQLNKINEGFGVVTGGVSSIANGIAQLGIDLPEGLQKTISAMQAISMILTGISSIAIAILAIQSVKATPVIGWLLHGGGTNKGGGRVVKAAEGYTVPGNYGYDAVPAMLTSGETVLNRAQTNLLASQLQGAGMGGMNLTATISGEQIRLALNNNGRRTGRGEYVTTNFR